MANPEPSKTLLASSVTYAFEGKWIVDGQQSVFKASNVTVKPSEPRPTAGDNLRDIIAELRRLIDRPDSTVYPSLGLPKIHYVAATKLTAIADNFEVNTKALEASLKAAEEKLGRLNQKIAELEANTLSDGNHHFDMHRFGRAIVLLADSLGIAHKYLTWEAKVQAVATAVHTLQVVSRARKLRTTSSLLDEYEDSIDSLSVQVNELGQSRDRWIELAQWSAGKYQTLKAETDRLETELAHSRKVSQARADCIGAYADTINAQAEEIFELKQKVDDLQLHPDRPSAAPRKPTLIQRLRKFLHV